MNSSNKWIETKFGFACTVCAYKAKEVTDHLCVVDKLTSSRLKRIYSDKKMPFMAGAFYDREQKIYNQIKFKNYVDERTKKHNDYGG